MAEKLLNFEILGRLGQGARSTIYAVIDPASHKRYALKHVVRVEPKDLRFIEQMETEFSISKAFTHPNLRRSFDLKVMRTLLMRVHEAFLIMELVEGRALDVRLPKDMVALTDTFIQTSHGLKALHQMGYVHCDIKPNNILRSDDGKVKIIDFGQSCAIGTTKERIQGTPDYMAPEQVARRPVTAQTDIFNLGATMYWAYSGGNNIPTLYKVNKQGENSFLLDAKISPPHELNPAIAPAISNLIMDCVASRTTKRPADMDQVISRLEVGQHVLQRNQADVAQAPVKKPDQAPE